MGYHRDLINGCTILQSKKRNCEKMASTAGFAARLAVTCLFVVKSTSAQQLTFNNPISDEKPLADPWVLMWNSSYYLIQAKDDHRLWLYKSNNLGNFRNAEKVLIHDAPPGTMWSRELWAPEFHYIQGNFYVYYAADDGNNVNHKMYVLRADDSANPMGTYSFVGKIADSEKDWWGIDGTVLQHENGKNYYIYSGWDGPYTYDPRVQHLFIAEMSSPSTLVPGTATLIRSPFFSWETDGQAVVEGPAVMGHGDKYFLMYSAGASWTKFYSTSMMAIDKHADPLDPVNWWVAGYPVFPRNEAAGVYGPGHPSFTKSPDGTEDWMVYHAMDIEYIHENGWTNRSPRAQKFHFGADGFPVFPPAAGFNEALALPSGTVL